MNCVPARLTWLGIVMVAAILPHYSGRKAWTVGLQQHALLLGPNSGWSEAATAGALQRRIVGPIWLKGVQVTDLWIGESGDPELSTSADVTRAIALTVITGVAFAALAVLAATHTFRALLTDGAWAQKYREKLVVIGVHTPEFAFEHNIDNVCRAVRRMGIEYPVVIDNDYSIWRAFNNQYWPALYFVDARGRTREHHFGEGEYQRSESAIQRLLAEAGVAVLRDGDTVSIDARGIEAAADWANLKSPETDIGYDRAQNFASRGGADVDRRPAHGVFDALHRHVLENPGVPAWWPAFRLAYDPGAAGSLAWLIRRPETLEV